LREDKEEGVVGTKGMHFSLSSHASDNRVIRFFFPLQGAPFSPPVRAREGSTPPLSTVQIHCLTTTRRLLFRGGTGLGLSFPLFFF